MAVVVARPKASAENSFDESNDGGGEATNEFVLFCLATLFSSLFSFLRFSFLFYFAFVCIV